MVNGLVVYVGLLWGFIVGNFENFVSDINREDVKLVKNEF